MLQAMRCLLFQPKWRCWAAAIGLLHLLPRHLWAEKLLFYVVCARWSFVIIPHQSFVLRAFWIYICCIPLIRKRTFHCLKILLFNWSALLLLPSKTFRSAFQSAILPQTRVLRHLMQIPIDRILWGRKSLLVLLCVEIDQKAVVWWLPPVGCRISILPSEVKMIMLNIMSYLSIFLTAGCHFLRNPKCLLTCGEVEKEFVLSISVRAFTPWICTVTAI